MANLFWPSPLVLAQGPCARLLLRLHLLSGPNPLFNRFDKSPAADSHRGGPLFLPLEFIVDDRLIECRVEMRPEFLDRCCLDYTNYPR